MDRKLVTIHQNGKVSIPSNILKELELKTTNQFEISLIDGQIVLSPVTFPLSNEFLSKVPGYSEISINEILKRIKHAEEHPEELVSLREVLGEEAYLEFLKIDPYDISDDDLFE